MLKMLMGLLGIGGAGAALWGAGSFSGTGQTDFLKGNYQQAKEYLGLEFLDGTVFEDVIEKEWPIIGTTLVTAAGLWGSGYQTIAGWTLVSGIGYALYDWMTAKDQFAAATNPANSEHQLTPEARRAEILERLSEQLDRTDFHGNTVVSTEDIPSDSPEAEAEAKAKAEAKAEAEAELDLK